MKYKAFISYNHKDLEVASWLHKKMDGYRPPNEKDKRRWRIFLDREELGASDNLPARIKKGLEQSETLIVICSPAAAQSDYVNQEISYFRQFADRQILFVIAEGTPHATDDECMPTELKRLATEPLGVDLRSNERSEAFLKVASGVLRIDYGDLANRERKRAVRRMLIGASIAGVVFFAIAAAGVVAVVQTDAVATRIAESKALRGLRYLEEKDKHNAVRLFRNSLSIADSELGREGLIRSLHRPITPARSWIHTDAAFRSVAFVSDGLIVAGEESGRLRLIDVTRDAELWSVEVGDAEPSSTSGINDVVYDSEADRIVAGSEDGLVYWIDPATGETSETYDTGHAVLSLRLRVNGQLLAIGTRGGLIVLDDARERVIDLMHGHAGTVQGMAFNYAGDMLYWGGSTKRIWACEIESSQCRPLQNVDEWVYAIDASSRFTAHGEGGKLTVLDHFLMRGQDAVRGGAHMFALRFDGSGDILIAGDSSGRISAFDVRAQALIQTVTSEGGQIYDVAFSPSGKHMASANLNGAISLWTITSTMISAPTYAKLGARNPMMLAREQPTAIHDIRIFDDAMAVVTDSQTRDHILPLPGSGAEESASPGEAPTFEGALRSQRSSFSRSWASTDINAAKAWREVHPSRAAAIDEISADTDGLRTASSPNATALAIVAEGRIAVLRSDSDEVRTKALDTSEVTSLAVSNSGGTVYLGRPNGKVAVLAMEGDGPAKLINCDDSEVFGIFAVSGGAGVVAATANGALCHINRDDGLLRRVETSIASAFAGSSEIGAVAIAGVAGSVYLFTTALDPVSTFDGHRGAVNALHFSVNGRILYSGGEDEALRSWEAGEAIDIRSQPWEDFFEDEPIDIDESELPALWPFLRWVGYL